MTPFWILEQDVFSERCFEEMIDVFKTDGIHHRVVEVIPFDHKIVGKKPSIPEGSPVVVYGSIGIQKICLREGWTPGLWTNEKFNAMEYQYRLGKHSLNYGGRTMKMSELRTMIDAGRIPEFFLRPNTDTKEFAGTVMQADEFGPWYEGMILSGYLDANDFDVFVARPKTIVREWRSVVVNGKVVASSRYRQHDVVAQQQGISDMALAATQRAVDLFSPADVFVVDVAQLEGMNDDPENFKVIEYNTFNSAGLYHCDARAIITAINDFVGGNNRV